MVVRGYALRSRWSFESNSRWAQRHETLLTGDHVVKEETLYEHPHKHGGLSVLQQNVIGLAEKRLEKEAKGCTVQGIDVIGSNSTLLLTHGISYSTLRAVCFLSQKFDVYVQDQSYQNLNDHGDE